MRTVTRCIASAILLIASTQAGVFAQAPAAPQKSTHPTADEVPRGSSATTDCEQSADEAEAALAEAVHQKESGAEPEPGERQRLVNGYSRLRPAYFERQRGLERAVVTARHCLEVASSRPEDED